MRITLAPFFKKRFPSLQWGLAIQIVRSLKAIAETQLNALAFFSRRQDRELLGAISRGLLDCPRRV